MKFFLAYLLLFVSLLATAQDDYSYVDSKALQIPGSQTYSTAGIAQYVNDNFTAEGERIRAVYTWVTHNIEYSKDSMFYFHTWGIDPEINMGAILRRRKGVCENYAQLFANIAAKCNIQAAVITGYTRAPGPSYWRGHGWVAVNINKQWLLCDPTWDAGHDGSYKYFLSPPAGFISTHLPFDPMWQLLEQPVSGKEFVNGNVDTKKETPLFNYNDTIAAYLQSDTLQQMEAAARRMKAAGLENEDMQTWYAYNQMKINIVRQEENMQLFNDAVADLNKAKKLYNELVQYRNSRFTPVRPETEIKTTIASIGSLLAAAYEKMNGVGKKAENYQYDTDGLKASLDDLSAKVKEQENFLKQYFAATGAGKQ